MEALDTNVGPLPLLLFSCQFLLLGDAFQWMSLQIVTLWTAPRFVADHFNAEKCPEPENYSSECGSIYGPVSLYSLKTPKSGPERKCVGVNE